jgi:hypothetical protein
MSIQTTYPFGYTPGLLGQPYDLTPYQDVTADAATAIGFGLGLVFDSSRTPQNNRASVKLPSASGDLFAGVAVLSRKQVTTGTPAGFGDLTTTEDAQYDIGDPIRLRTKGRLYVWSEQAVGPTDPVYLRFTANGAGTLAGYFRKDADTNKASLIANARWVGTITAAGIIVLEINKP